jgi:hypothetical protein
MHRQPKRHSTVEKYLAVQKRYRELFDGQRMRHDDVIEQLRHEFFIAHPNTVYKILATEISEEDEADSEGNG